MDKSAHETHKQRGKTWKKNVPVRVAGQRRLAFKSASRTHRPDFHRLIIAAAGQLAILAPCNRHHPVIVRSQHTNQQKQRDKKTCKKKTYTRECPVRVDSTNPVRASQTNTRNPSARASLDPSGEKATASISSPPRIVNLHAWRRCRGSTCSMKA